jgi:hypothetical protein
MRNLGAAGRLAEILRSGPRRCKGNKPSMSLRGMVCCQCGGTNELATGVAVNRNQGSTDALVG